MHETTSDIIYSDMSICAPRAGLSREHRSDTWRLVDYEAFDGTKGVMVFSDPELGAPELTLPLEANGLYKIFLGITYWKSRWSTQYSGYSRYGSLQVKLTGDLGFHRVGSEPGGYKNRGPSATPVSKMGMGKYVVRSVQEAYWKIADITDKDFHFKPVGAPYNNWKWGENANLTWVRLVPLTEEEERTWHDLQPTNKTRILTARYCGGNISGHIDEGPEAYQPTTFSWFEDEMAPFIDSDINLIIFELIRGNYCAYNTKIGDVGRPDNEWKHSWVDPIESFSKIAHDHGMEISIALRMIGANLPTTRDEIGWASYFWKHPEFWRRDRDGTPTTSLSLAFPEVQDYWISLLREALEYDIDGITIYLHRFVPFVLFEEPVIESFKGKHNEDPRDLPENDPRWIQHCADYVTGFLKEVRKVVDEKPGRKLGISLYGGPSQYNNTPDWHPIQYNCDVERWIEDGIAHNLFLLQHPKVDYVRRWVELGKGKVNIFPDIRPDAANGESYAWLAKKYYEAGVQGLNFGDSERMVPQLTDWEVIKRLGHRDRLEDLDRLAEGYYRRVPLKTLMGFSTRYSFNNFGGIDPLAAEMEDSAK